MEGAPAGLVRIHAVRHDGDGVALAVKQRQFANHALSRRKLVFATKRHNHATGADTAVEHLDQALLRTDIQIA